MASLRPRLSALSRRWRKEPLKPGSEDGGWPGIECTEQDRFRPFDLLPAAGVLRDPASTLCRACRLGRRRPTRRPFTGSRLMRGACGARPYRYHDRDPEEDATANQARDNYCSDEQIGQPPVLAQARLPMISQHGTLLGSCSRADRR